MDEETERERGSRYLLNFTSLFSKKAHSRVIPLHIHLDAIESLMLRSFASSDLFQN